MSYPPIYIINLKRNPERKSHMRREFDAFDLRYQFVEAIDKYDLCSQEGRKTVAYQLGIGTHQIDSMLKTQSNMGTVACALSHIKVYNLMIENNISRACVLEDDVCLLPTFPKILTVAQEFSWDLLMLAHQSEIVKDMMKEWRCFNERRYQFYHILKSLLKLILYKKYYPQLNYHYVYSLFSYTIRYIFFLVRHALSIKKRYPDTVGLYYYGCKIGAMPTQNKFYRHRLVSKHYITKPMPIAMNVISAAGYMLTCSMATKWKHAILSRPELGYMIDLVPISLYCEGELDLHIVSSPCVTASFRYLCNSSRRY